MRRSHARFLHPCYPPVRPAARRAGTAVAHRPGMVPDTGRRGCARASVRLVLALSLAVWLCAARPAAAMRACGDDVDGHGKAVPCACGVLLVRGSLSLQGPGAIEGFGTGVLARGRRALTSAVGMRFSRNGMSGLVAESEGYTVEGSVAEHNGQDGFALGGRGYALDGNR